MSVGSNPGGTRVCYLLLCVRVCASSCRPHQNWLWLRVWEKGLSWWFRKISRTILVARIGCFSLPKSVRVVRGNHQLSPFSKNVNCNGFLGTPKRCTRFTLRPEGTNCAQQFATVPRPPGTNFCRPLCQPQMITECCRFRERFLHCWTTMLQC